MKKNSLIDLANNVVSKNQDLHRLTSSPLADLNSLPIEAQQAIKTFIGSNTDKAHVALGVLIYAILSTNKAVFVLSQDDLQKLIDTASKKLSFDSFKVDSKRGSMTIYAQFTGLIVQQGICKVLRASKKGCKLPAVLEVTSESLLNYLNIQDIEAARLQVINTTRLTKQQDNKATRLQYYNTTRHSELVDELEPELVDELVDELVNSVQDIPTSLSESQYERQSETQEVVDITQLQQKVTVTTWKQWGERTKKNV